ncbi:MAG TPA: cell division protein ZapA, partial [Vicinamibacteria bacterium]|nr:cell division protein ZapA [Vicinamibacteria bacterium]
MPDKPNLVHVEIFGQSYALRAGEDPAYLERLAALVDGHMKEVAKAAGAVDSVRVAVLAALNIADELVQARAHGGREEALGRRAAALAR